MHSLQHLVVLQAYNYWALGELGPNTTIRLQAGWAFLHQALGFWMGQAWQKWFGLV